MRFAHSCRATAINPGDPTRALDLFDIAGHSRKGIIGCRTDKSDDSHHDYKNDRQHDCIFSYVLTIIVLPCPAKKFDHVVLLGKMSGSARKRQQAGDDSGEPHKAK